MRSATLLLVRFKSIPGDDSTIVENTATTKGTGELPIYLHAIINLHHVFPCFKQL